MFYITWKCPTANYEHNTAPCTCGKNSQDVITSLENCALVLFRWFENNLFNKSHLLLSTPASSTANINGDIQNSESEKPLGVMIDYRLNFAEHLSKRYVIKSDKNVMLLHAFLHISILIREHVL